MLKLFDVSASALSAQSLRLNTVASNLANADSVASTPEGAYRARNPVFAAVLKGIGAESTASVEIKGVVESQAPAVRRHEPANPLADAEGYVYGSNVNVIEEMANMISASRAYQNNIEVMNTSKQLLLGTLKLGE
jgi:flagellar basal-body rod protein FlgC